MYQFAKSSELKGHAPYRVSDLIIKALNENGVYVKSISQVDDKSNSVKVASRSVSQNMYERGIDCGDVCVYGDGDDGFLTKAFGMSPSAIELRHDIELVDKFGIYHVKYCVHQEHYVFWSLQTKA